MIIVKYRFLAYLVFECFPVEYRIREYLLSLYFFTEYLTEYLTEYRFAMSPPGKSTAQKKEKERLAQYMDAVMASEAGRALVSERAQNLGLTASSAATPASTSPELAQLQTAMASLADAVKALASTSAASKRPRSASPVPGPSSAPDLEPPKRSKDDPLPPPLQRPFGKGAYARSTDPLFSSEGKHCLSISAAIPVLCVVLDVEWTPSIM